MLRSVSDNNIMTDSSLTFIKKSLHVEKYIGESGQLLLILQQLCQVVSDGLCVVVGDRNLVTHHEYCVGGADAGDVDH